MTGTAKKMAAMDDSATTLCLVPDCQNSGEIRGLCKNHYGYIGKLIREGKIAGGWKGLEKLGKAMPRRHIGMEFGELIEWLRRREKE